MSSGKCPTLLPGAPAAAPLGFPSDGDHLGATPRSAGRDRAPMRRVRLALALGLLGGAGAVGIFAWETFHRVAIPPPGGVGILVSPRTPFRRIAEDLAASGLLAHPRLFVWWARLRGADRHVRSGRYWVRRPITPERLLAMLQRGPTDTRRVTIPEGLTALETTALLAQKGIGTRSAYRCALEDPALLAELSLPATGFEGYLFPDTYVLPADVGAADVLRAMVRRFRAVAADLAPRRRALGLTEAEMVTLASLIEKETARAEERALVSAVFHNRLRRGMRLQSDPTVIYALGLAGPPTVRDLAADAPYNTYRSAGLPPGPIANPGRAALEAAVTPADTKALYFVASGGGAHHFSVSLEEHLRAVRRYRARRRGGRPDCSPCKSQAGPSNWPASSFGSSRP